MNCVKCNAYFPSDEKSCPWCGWKPTRADRAADRKAAEASAREITREDEERGELAYNRVWKPGKVIESVVLISTGTKTKIGGLGRAAVGGILAGPIGGLIGVATTDYRKTATFSVKYADGKTEAVTAVVGSKKFAELSAMLHK